MSNNNTTAVYRVDPNTGAKTSVVVPGVAKPAVAYDPNNNEMYVPGTTTTGVVDQLDPTTGTLTPLSPYVSGSTATPGSIRAMAYDTDNGYLYVDDGHLWQINLATGTETEAISATKVAAYGMAYDPATGLLYVGNTSGTLRALNPTTGAVTTIVASGLGYDAGVAYDPDNKNLYVMDYHTGDLWKINPTTGTTVVAATPGVNGYGVTYDTNNGYLYITGQTGTLYKVAP